MLSIPAAGKSFPPVPRACLENEPPTASRVIPERATVTRCAQDFPRFPANPSEQQPSPCRSKFSRMMLWSETTIPLCARDFPRIDQNSSPAHVGVHFLGCCYGDKAAMPRHISVCPGCFLPAPGKSSQPVSASAQGLPTK